MAATCCSKSAATYLVTFVLAALAQWGRTSGKLVLRADPEVALSVILDELKARRGDAETLVERSAVGSHQSVGTVERANRE